MCLMPTICFFFLNRRHLCLSPGLFLTVARTSWSCPLQEFLLPSSLPYTCTFFFHRRTHCLAFQQTIFLSTSLHLRPLRSGLFLFAWHLVMLIKPSLLSNFLCTFRGAEDGTKHPNMLNKCSASDWHLQPSNFFVSLIFYKIYFIMDKEM